MSLRARLVLLLLGAMSVTISAQTLRLGSPAPENSPWGRALNRIAAEWEDASDGRVRVHIFHNSIAGTEADMIRKMRIGQLQAVVITATGLSHFSDKAMTLSMPLLIRDQDEYTHVFSQVKGDLEADILEEGFHVMGWSFSGWARFFGRDAIRAPSDLRDARLAASPEEMELIRAYQLMGYQPVPLPYAERLTGLTTGMADALLTVPLLAAGFQWFAATPYMTNLRISPTPAAVLMSDRSYRQLSPALRDELFEVIERVTAGLDAEILALEQEAIDTMVQFGLNIVDLTSAETDTWIGELEDSYAVTLGLVFDEDLYRKIQAILNDLRSQR